MLLLYSSAAAAAVYEAELPGEPVAAPDFQEERPEKRMKVTKDVSFTGYEPKVVELYPAWIRAQLPFSVTHKGGLSM